MSRFKIHTSGYEYRRYLGKLNVVGIPSIASIISREKTIPPMPQSFMTNLNNVRHSIINSRKLNVLKDYAIYAVNNVTPSSQSIKIKDFH